MKYAKLVRDKIPSIIRKNGDVPVFHVASKKEYEPKLHAKLQEEVNEFLQNETKEELADVLEVIHAICKYHKFDLKKVEQLRKRKAKERGAFTKRIILDETN